MIKMPVVNSTITTILSDDDEWIKEYKIYRTRGNYLSILFEEKLQRLNRVILAKKLERPITPGMYCDHINRNIHDNRRENLREVSPLESSKNQKHLTGSENVFFGRAGCLHHKSKRVKCLNDGLEFESANLAAKFYGLKRSEVAVVARGVDNRGFKRKSIKGLSFIYISNV